MINKKSINEKREKNKLTKKIRVCSIRDVKKDFTIFHNATVTLLDSEALHIYLYLLSKCMNKEFCYPSREQIIKDTGINKNKLTSIFKYLQDFGLLRIEKRKNGTNFNNVYHMYAIKEVTEIKEKDGILIEIEH